MEIPTIITPQIAAASKVINTARDSRPGCLMTIGALDGAEAIQIQRPLVQDPDPDDDAHWVQLVQADTDAALRVGNDAYAVPVGVVIRIVKPVTTGEVGVIWA